MVNIMNDEALKQAEAELIRAIKELQERHANELQPYFKKLHEMRSMRTRPDSLVLDSKTATYLF